MSTTAAHSAVGDSGSTSGRPIFATGGNAPAALRDQIAWISWGNDGAGITSGRSVTNWVQVGPQARTEVTCTLTHSGAALKAERPAQGGSAFQHRYNSGSSGSGNQLHVGVSPTGDATFTVACQGALVTYDGGGWSAGNRVTSSPLALPGLVVADSGSTYAASEAIQIRPNPRGDVAWRVLDREHGCSGSPYMTAAKSANGVLELKTVRTVSGWLFPRYGLHECSSSPGTAMVVAHVDGVSSVEVFVDNTGHQSVAIGYMHSFDFGDAPQSYGAAGAQNAPWVNASMLSTGTTTVAGEDAVATTSGVVGYGPETNQAHATPRLGASLTFERHPHSSSEATGDADNGFGASPPSNLPAASAGGVVTVSPLCRGAGSMTGWIDWNRDGAFDEGEQSDVVACASTATNGASVNLTWTVPADADGGPTFMRLMVAANANELAPAGIVSRGEVEDYPVTAMIRDLRVTMTADRTEVPDAGEDVTYTITVKNVGNAGFTAGQPAYAYNSFAGVFDDAAPGLTTTPDDAADRVFRWSGELAAGAEVTFPVPFTVRANPGDLVMTNLVRVASGPLSLAQQRASCESPELDAGKCATSTLYRVDVEVTKRAYDKETDAEIADGETVAPGTEVVWRYTVRNTGSIALSGIQLTDAATETKWESGDSTSVSSSPTISCSGNPAVAPGTTVMIPTLAPGAQRVCQAEGVIGGT